MKIGLERSKVDMGELEEALGNNKEFILFSVLTDYMKESGDTVEQAMRGVAPALVLCKPEVTETEFKQYMRIMGIDLSDPESWEVVSRFFSVWVYADIIKVTSFEYESLLDDRYEELRGESRLAAYRELLRTDCYNFAQQFDLE
jgi:hypothetical protein